MCASYACIRYSCSALRMRCVEDWLAPALTTITGVRPSSPRSADRSIESSPPRWTPPIPPVTNVEMPAACARSIVHDTVVPPWPPRDTQCARSRRESLETAPSDPSCAKRSSSSSSRPMQQTPSSTAIVAGVAPFSTMAFSTLRAVSKFRGYGIPWLMIVDSSATTASPRSSAERTSGWILSGGDAAAMATRR